MIASAKIGGARIEVPADGRAGLDVLVRNPQSYVLSFCLLIVSLLPLDAAAQITESLLPNAVPPSTPQTPTSAFAPLGLRMGDFFWYPRAELDQAYNSNIFATTTGYTYDLITALTSSFDLLSNFSRNSLNLHGGSLLQVYADHPAQNTQDGVLSADGSLDVTPGAPFTGLHSWHTSIYLTGHPIRPATLRSQSRTGLTVPQQAMCKAADAFPMKSISVLHRLNTTPHCWTAAAYCRRARKMQQPIQRRFAGAMKSFRIIWAISVSAPAGTTIGILSLEELILIFQHIASTSGCKSFLDTSFLAKSMSDTWSRISPSRASALPLLPTMAERSPGASLHGLRSALAAR